MVWKKCALSIIYLRKTENLSEEKEGMGKREKREDREREQREEKRDKRELS